MSRNAYGFGEPSGAVAVKTRPETPPDMVVVEDAPERTPMPAPAPVVLAAPLVLAVPPMPPMPALLAVPAAPTTSTVAEALLIDPRVDDPRTEAVPVEMPGLPRPASHGRHARPSRVGSALRLVRALVLSGLLGVVVAIVVLFLGSIPLGYRSLTVMSGSMEPTLGVGDVVMERQVAPLDVHVGDIVTFRDPNEQTTLITHRVRSLKVHNGTVDFVTKGDANNTVERWTIPTDGQLGLVVVHLPKVGYALVWASGETGRIALIAIPGVILGVLELLRIWRPRRSPA